MIQHRQHTYPAGQQELVQVDPNHLATVNGRRQEPEVTLHGFCSLSQHAIRDCIRGGRYAEVLGASGNFVAVVSGEAEVTIVTSAHCVTPYYYSIAEGRFVHGRSVAEVFKASKLPWKWNYVALADYLTLDHVIGDATLHPSIFRTQPNTTVTYSKGELRYPSVANVLSQSASPADVDGAVRTLAEEIPGWWSPDSVLCLSGGLDSRLLLAALLHSGIRPRALIVGQRGSFDREVACALAEQFQLEADVAEVRLSDFIESADMVALATNGLLPVSHWPGALIARHAVGARLFLGFNGEYARSYYHDKGLISLMYDALPPGRRARDLFARRFTRPFKLSETQRLSPLLAEHLSPEGSRNRLDRLLPRTWAFGDRLDHVYLTQYVRNKTGSDIAAVSIWARWVAPLLSRRWIADIGCLPRRWKLGSRFHRHAIAKLSPPLVHYPDEMVCGLLSRSSRRVCLSHFVDQSIYESRELLGFASTVLQNIAGLVDPMLLADIARDPERRRLLFQLATLAIWYRAVVAPQRQA